MRLGCAEIDITPPLPVFLGGYGARTEPARGISMPLFARSFVFQANGTRFAIITLDILMLSARELREIRRRVTELSGIPENHIIVTASHTHSGPGTGEFGEAVGLGKADSTYINWLLRALPGTILEASRRMEEVWMGVASGQVAGVGLNRRDPAMPVDSEVVVLAFAKSDGSPQAVLVNYACHPTVLGPDNLLVSPDYPGAAVQGIRRYLPQAVVGFINGACGDVSARFTRREQSEGEIFRLGTILAGRVISLYGEMEFHPVHELGGRQSKLPLTFKDYPPAAEIDRQIRSLKEKLAAQRQGGESHARIRVTESALEGAEIEKAFAGLLPELEQEAEINTWRLGPVGIATIPGELFSKLGKDIKAASPFTKTVVAGYTNGYIGYIPTEEAYTEGGYEASSTPLARGTGEKIVASAVEGLKNIQES